MNDAEKEEWIHLNVIINTFLDNYKYPDIENMLKITKHQNINNIKNSFITLTSQILYKKIFVE